MTIKEALASNEPIDDITICGWVRTRRDSKGFSFLSINDGSCLANIQAIVDEGIPGSESISAATTGSSVKVKGQLVESPGKGQSYEIKALEIEVTGTADDTYPLQKM